MLSVVSAGIGGMDRLVGSADKEADFERALAIERERQIRIRSVQRDFKLNLPHSISINDESPFRDSIRASKSIEVVYQQLITAPPNRTVFEAESPPPYRPIKGLKSSTSTSTTFHQTQTQPPLLQSSFTESSSSLLSTCPMTSNYYSTVSNNAALTTCTTVSNESIQSYSVRSGLISLPSNLLSSSSSSSNLVSSTTSSLSSTSSSSNSNHFINTNNNGNKTDFLQKTVKILTGKKNQSLSPSRSPNPSTPLPVILVPNKTKRIPNESQQKEQQPSCSCCLSNNSTGPSHTCKCTGANDSTNRPT